MATGAANTSTPALVGWTAGPETRGTLTLVWSCVITIFACTWTVLHLNVPARDEGWFPVLLRKVKWMAINILFPEFIFAKGVCDLRLALEELREFDESEQARKPIDAHLLSEWTVTSEDSSSTYSYNWAWEFQYPPWAQWLYRLLRLTPPSQTHNQKPSPTWISTFIAFFRSKAKSSETRIDTEAQDHPHAYNLELAPIATSPSNPAGATSVPQDRHGTLARASSSASSIASPVARKELSGPQPREKVSHNRPTNVQKWTIVHSYYAQMGGIRYQRQDKEDTNWYCLTASMLTARYTFSSYEKRSHFDRLILDEQDIKDKSKADWLLKGIAVTQVSWLILSVIVRGILHLPITQLEIATISFAGMAVLSYMANWWKPKDISQATSLSLPAGGFTGNREAQPVAYAQSIISRLWSPTKTRNEAVRLDDRLLRVPNDLVWMKGEGPLLFILMAFSSLGFGGLHCLAWNFEFPSSAELLCWRVASLISAALPTITLVTILILPFLATKYTDSRLVSIFLRKLKPLNGLKPDFWEYIKNPHWAGWGRDAKLFLARNPTGSRNWDEEPSAEIIEEHRNSEIEQSYPWNFPIAWLKFSEVWQKARGKTPPAARSLLKEWFLNGDWMERISKNEPKEVNFWQDYENHIRKTHGIRDPETADRDWITFILRAYNEAKEECVWWHAFNGVLDKASIILTIVSGVIYAVARLTILVLLFTCLRETPVDVYRVTPWINFLPNIS
ncbi:hypothetical protein CSPX01_02845 [Colletotrichum filicis]|nr:hypothetical protein CSPX01_02845 [Colletotrichum filicis]